MTMKFYKPKRVPEANLQAELYYRLMQYDINCFLEYPVYKEGKGKLRADCVILDAKKENVLMAIEVKSYRDPNYPMNMTTKQLRRYREFFPGIDIRGVRNKDDIEKVIDELFTDKYWDYI